MICEKTISIEKKIAFNENHCMEKVKNADGWAGESFRCPQLQDVGSILHAHCDLFDATVRLNFENGHIMSAVRVSECYDAVNRTE